MRHLSRRGFIAGATCLAGAPSLAEFAPPRPRPLQTINTARPQAVDSLEQILAYSGFKDITAAIVIDLKTQTILEAHQADLPLPPASVAKIVTSAYAYDHLGSAFRFSTQLLATGPIQNGVINGDLILAGGGDPQLDTDALVRMVEDLAALGITSITGHFYIWPGAIPYQRQISPEQPEYLSYNTSISGLNLNYNVVTFSWKPKAGGYTTEMIAESENYFPRVSNITSTIANRDLPIFSYTQNGTHEEWSVARSALGRGGQRWLPVRRPDIFAGEVFQIMAKERGIKLPKAERIERLPQAALLSDRRSLPLPDMLQAMLKYSNNLMAETIGLKATLRDHPETTTITESAARLTEWAQTITKSPTISLADHSGLSDLSFVSAKNLAYFVSQYPQLFDLLKDFPISTKQKPKDVPQQISIKAKTGTLNFAKSLSGVILGGERELGFAILSADLEKRKTIAKSDRENPKGAEEFMEKAFELQRALLWRWVNSYAVSL